MNKTAGDAVIQRVNNISQLLENEKKKQLEYNQKKEDLNILLINVTLSLKDNSMMNDKNDLLINKIGKFRYSKQKYELDLKRIQLLTQKRYYEKELKTILDQLNEIKWEEDSIARSINELNDKLIILSNSNQWKKKNKDVDVEDNSDVDVDDEAVEEIESKDTEDTRKLNDVQNEINALIQQKRQLETLQYLLSSNISTMQDIYVNPETSDVIRSGIVISTPTQGRVKFRISGTEGSGDTVTLRVYVDQWRPSEYSAEKIETVLAPLVKLGMMVCMIMYFIFLLSVMDYLLLSYVGV